jgi:hypothetical protein
MYLRLKGHFCWRQNVGAARQEHTTSRGMKKFYYIKFGYPGISDILGIAKDGRMIAVECKVKPRKPTDLQVEFLNEVSKRGGYAILAYSIDDVTKHL